MLDLSNVLSGIMFLFITVLFFAWIGITSILFVVSLPILIPFALLGWIISVIFQYVMRR